jgi:maltooligosyltrehalose trehalohydrolase
MVAISRKVRAAGQGRGTYIVAENECQHAKLVRSVEEGGYGMDALWNDDFHHTAIVACTGRSEAYYTDYKGTPQEFISAVKWGFLYQGQWYRWQTKRRGAPALDLHPSQFVAFVQNHDQIANSLRGKRLQQLTSPGRLRAITTLLLLGPGTPMLFQGQEFGASAPFYYFADHNPQLAKLVGAGRKEYLKQFPSIASPECDLMFINPDSEETFRCCKLDFSEREEHADIYRMHRDLLRLRREDPAFARPRTGGVDGAVLAPEAFVLRFFGERNRNPKDGANAERLISLSPQRGEGRGEGCGERLMIVNFGTDLHLDPAPEPLLAPPEGCQWKLLWSSEDPCYGGSGTPPVNSGGDWCVPAHSAIVVGPETLRDLHGYSDTQN